MAEENILKKLRETFPAATKDDWKQAASQEIDGKNPMETLQWNIAGSPAFEAYYHQPDSAVPTGIKNYQLPVSPHAFASPRAWINLPKITVTNAVTANATALNHLQHGAEGVWFDVTQSNPDFSSLLEKIEWPNCFVAFQLNEKNFFSLVNFIEEKKYPDNSITGALFWSLLPENLSAVAACFPKQQKIKTLGLRIPATSPVEEISTALTTGVGVIEKITEHSTVPHMPLHQLAFSLSADTNFFLTIAKLKALRILWYQVAQAYGEKMYSPADLHVHTYAQSWVAENYQPHGNLLKGTTTTMAAVLGGSDSVTVEPEAENNSTMNRIARNVSTILHEESHLDKVADALAGAFAIDTLVNELAAKAWADFQVKTKSHKR